MHRWTHAAVAATVAATLAAMPAHGQGAAKSGGLLADQVAAAAVPAAGEAAATSDLRSR